MSTAADVMTAMAHHASDAAVLQRFFKTGPGQYGEGDQFIGVRVPMTRRGCAQFRDLPLGEIRRLLASPIHEHRLAACIIMTLQAKSADDTHLRALHDLYLEGLDHHQINNWDIIDTTCDYVIGEYAYRHDPRSPYRLARSDQLWHKRAGMVMCFTWLKRGDVGPTLDIAELHVMRASQHC